MLRPFVCDFIQSEIEFSNCLFVKKVKMKMGEMKQECSLPCCVVKQQPDV
jgi:hypothetical protein